MSYGGNGDRGPFLNTINWVFNAIAFAAVLLRFGTHIIREKQRWELDDFFIILAMVVNLARSICLSIAISRGFGQHLAILIEKSPPNTTALLHLMVVIQAVGLWTFALPKLPVASLLVRLFGKVNRLAYVVYPLVGLLITFVTVTTITTFQQCKPVAAQWDSNIPGHCWNRSVNIGLGYFVGSLSASLDFGFALYAVVTVMSLNMTSVQKIVIASSMGLGFGACAVSIYKLTIIKEINNISDPTWATVPLEVWNR
ncbi:hypothetical protein TCE0_004r00265 [Talaromyces pinophilus]|uniref:Rhodopsin domain-containing protein n=1 Tax=Talaromyces pinophilus TaxID=128442 RepID=A0A0B8MXT4_TALPI|nr:hypothetical protein TCE0_004r00265 [Talaromyces pinophilus]